ncbi:MAG: hypothetical protein WBA23_23760 [Tunicatimonas sp.]|uniref:hypothetical protein n=1 Tax=Tunicatimonas sp. TaxID=1940096 RepID=UPI003C78EB8D
MDKVKQQEIYRNLWEQHKDGVTTDDEGTYVDLKNFNIADHGLSTEETGAPGKETFSSTDNRKDGYSLRRHQGGFRLFKGI